MSYGSQMTLSVSAPENPNIVIISIIIIIIGK